MRTTKTAVQVVVFEEISHILCLLLVVFALALLLTLTLALALLAMLSFLVSRRGRGGRRR